MIIYPFQDQRSCIRPWEDRWEGHASFTFSFSSLLLWLSHHHLSCLFSTNGDWEMLEEGALFFHPALPNHCHPRYSEQQDSVLSNLWRNCLGPVYHSSEKQFSPSVLQLMEEQNHWVMKLIWIWIHLWEKVNCCSWISPRDCCLIFQFIFPSLLMYVYWPLHSPPMKMCTFNTTKKQEKNHFLVNILLVELQSM